MSTHAKAFLEHCWTYPQRSDTADDRHPSADQPISDADVGLIDVMIFWTPSARSPLGTEWRDGLIVVDCVMARGFSEASRQRLPISAQETEGRREDHTSAHYFLDAFDHYTARNLAGPAWKKS